MVINGNFSGTFPAKKFICKECDYYTSKTSHFREHVLTAKHAKRCKMVTNDNFSGISGIFPTKAYIETFICDCGKKYKHASGLSRHRLICCKNQSIDKQQLLMIIQEQNNLKNFLIENCNQTNNNTLIQNNNVNSNNKFNLNVFLNEKCKNALNIEEFINSIKLQIKDLENVGKNGFVHGISNIIITNLNALDVYKRPVHCSDAKRDIIYIKDENKWQKDNEEKKKLRKFVKKIVNRNISLIPDFKSKYPDCINSTSTKSDDYNKIVIEAFGGKGERDIENETKIIRNVAKEIIIDK
jgi:hypothetical protein